MSATLSAEAVRVPLGVGASPAQVLLALPGAHRVCLTGGWAGGGALLASDPLRATSDLTDFGDLPAVPADEDFVGGGWFGQSDYDGRSRFAYYDHVLRWWDGQWWFEAIATAPRREALAERQAELATVLAGARAGVEAGAFEAGAFAGADRDAHLAAVERAVEAIRAGELYQVNVCTRLSASFAGNPAALFARAAAALQPAYGAYLEGVVSLSPELFLRRRGRTVTTKPIKGTRPIGVPADELRASTKDAAENVMIVDLMRNDLGRVCVTGSVRVPRLLEVEAHPGIWHLVSTVAGELRPGVTDAELLAATLPPGSVTGAPKSRALTLITELETVPRGAYTGVIGFVSPAWGAEFSVAIRTFEVGEHSAELGVGGGVTADSVPMLEWRECLDKAAPLVTALGSTVEGFGAPTAEPPVGGLLETVLAVAGVPLRLADHLARLDRSARELYGRGIPADLAVRATAAVAGSIGPVALRIVLAAGGSATVEARPAPEPVLPRPARLVHGRSGLWRHKWADRTYLASTEDQGAVPLFVAADGGLLETSRGNLFVIADDGVLVTPPLRDDLLPGVTRRALLDLARDRGLPTRLAAITLDDAQTARAVFWTSSLSGAVPITAIDGGTVGRDDARVGEFASALLAPGRLLS